MLLLFPRKMQNNYLEKIILSKVSDFWVLYLCRQKHFISDSIRYSI